MTSLRLPLLLLLALLVPLRLATAQVAKQDPDVMALPEIPAWSGDFDGMQQRRLVRILVPISRTGFFIDRGRALGVEAEIGQALEHWLNRRYPEGPRKFHVGFIPTPGERLLAELNAGKGDIAAGLLTITDERKAAADFAEPWAVGVKEVVVTGPTAPALRTLDDLGGKTVTVRRSASYYTHLAAINAQRKAGGKQEMTLRPADENLADEDLLEMVGGGLLPYAVVDRFKGILWARLIKGLVVREDLVVNDGGAIAWAVRKNSPGLQRELAAFMAEHKIGTTFGNELRRRYMIQGTTIKNALANGDKDELTKLLPAFNRYGDEYAIDPLLIAAQGYQESRLNQALKSRAGAVGIMQIKPSTARAQPIGIKDVATSADNNIHAGAKYLRYLADTYVADPAIEARERVLLALAAYNAGPGNLRRFQAYAKKHGYDPTRWFGNVENGAAALVGRETVHYIGNIYKYYVSYAALDLEPGKPADASPKSP